MLNRQEQQELEERFAEKFSEANLLAGVRELREVLATELLLAQRNWESAVDWWRQQLHQDSSSGIDLRVLAAGRYVWFRKQLERVDALLSDADRLRTIKRISSEGGSDRRCAPG